MAGSSQVKPGHDARSARKPLGSAPLFGRVLSCLASSPIEAGAGSSDRGRAAQCIAPMRYPLLEGTLAPVSQLLEIDLFEDLEGETFRPMGVPGGLKRLVPLDALPHANERRVQIVERSGAAPTHCPSVAAHRIAYTPATALRSL